MGDHNRERAHFLLKIYDHTIGTETENVENPVHFTNRSVLNFYFKQVFF